MGAQGAREGRARAGCQGAAAGCPGSSADPPCRAPRAPAFTAALPSPTPSLPPRPRTPLLHQPPRSTGHISSTTPSLHLLRAPPSPPPWAPLPTPCLGRGRRGRCWTHRERGTHLEAEGRCPQGKGAQAGGREAPRFSRTLRDGQAPEGVAIARTPADPSPASPLGTV